MWLKFYIVNQAGDGCGREPAYFRLLKNIISIQISTIWLQEFNIEKLQLVEADKKKIKQEYDRKAKQVDVRKKMCG